MQSTSSSAIPILQRWIAGHHTTAAEQQQLLAEELAAPQQAKALGITPANSSSQIEQRSRLFQAVYPEVAQLCQRLGIEQSDRILITLWRLWLPLAMQIASQRQKLERPLVQGILGLQGTGKTTLAAVIRLILEHLGYRPLSFSIDDLYKTYSERKRLQENDPRFLWRGPPGSHDVDLGVQLFEQVRNYQSPIDVPRFDKSAFGGAGERTEPERVDEVDIVLFEGWFVGVRPIDERAFDNPPPPISTQEDRSFAQEINRRLRDYLPLWEGLDRLMVLSPVEYRLSQQWRREAEQNVIASGKSGMSDAEVNQFVEYFWRSLHPELFITPLINNPSLVELVIEIHPDRSAGAIYKPVNRA